MNPFYDYKCTVSAASFEVQHILLSSFNTEIIRSTVGIIWVACEYGCILCVPSVQLHSTCARQRRNNNNNNHHLYNNSRERLVTLGVDILLILFFGSVFFLSSKHSVHMECAHVLVCVQCVLHFVNHFILFVLKNGAHHKTAAQPDVEKTDTPQTLKLASTTLSLCPQLNSSG